MDRRARLCSSIAAFGAAIYLAVLVTLPFVDRTFNALAAHPEDYATGTFGVVVNLSYIALAVALACFLMSVWPVKGLGIAFAVVAVPPLILCTALAADPIGIARGGTVLLLPIVCLALVPLIGSIALKDRVGGWRSMLAGLAVVVLVAFAGLVFAPNAVAGVVNRAFDVALGAWIVVAAIAVSISPRGDRQGQPDNHQSRSSQAG